MEIAVYLLISKATIPTWEVNLGFAICVFGLK
jgi:hypothetical protein